MLWVMYITDLNAECFLGYQFVVGQLVQDLAERP